MGILPDLAEPVPAGASMNPLFRIAFDGQLGPGTHPGLVRSLIARRMKLNQLQVERMFSGRKVILKNNLPEDEALAFADRLHKLGMLVSTEPMPEIPDTIPVSLVLGQSAAPPLAIVPQADNEEIDTPAPQDLPPPAPAQMAPQVASGAAEEISLPPPHLPAAEAPQRFEDSWLTASSFANLARTHLNLDRAEALLRFGQPSATDSALPGTGPDFGAAARLFEDADELVPRAHEAHAPVQVSTEFCCTHCGTMLRIELNIAPIQGSDQIRVRQESASA